MSLVIVRGARADKTHVMDGVVRVTTDKPTFPLLSFPSYSNNVRRVAENRDIIGESRNSHKLEYYSSSGALQVDGTANVFFYTVNSRGEVNNNSSLDNTKKNNIVARVVEANIYRRGSVKVRQGGQTVLIKWNRITRWEIKPPRKNYREAELAWERDPGEAVCVGESTHWKGKNGKRDKRTVSKERRRRRMRGK